MDRPEVLGEVRAVGARLLHVEPDRLSDRAVFDDLDSLTLLEPALAQLVVAQAHARPASASARTDV